MSEASWRFLTTVVCVLVLASACVRTQPEQPTPSTYDPSQSRAENIRAWEQFNNSFDNRWRVTWNPVTGTPHRISGRGINISVDLTEQNIERVTRGILAQHKSILQIDPENLRLNKADFAAPRQPGRSTGTWYVFYGQVHRGVPVDGGSVRVIIRNQHVTSLGSDYFPGIDLSPDPRVTLAEATATASSHMGQNQSLAPVNSKLLVFPKRDAGRIRYHLAWRITMPIAPVERDVSGELHPLLQNPERSGATTPVQWMYYIDAHTGEVVERFNVARSADLNGTVHGMVHPLVPADTPQMEPLSNMTVTLSQDGSTLSTDTIAGGNYGFAGLTDGSAGIEAHLTGPHVIVKNENTADPDATHTATVAVPGDHSWTWQPGEPSPRTSEINTFYHVDWIRDWFLQVDPTLDNPSPYPMPVTVGGIVFTPTGATPCNATAGPDGLAFGKGNPGQCEDFGLCADVIYHEYTHRVVEKAYEDTSFNPFITASDYSGAMHEGWADYFGTTATQDPVIAEGCMPSVSRNIDAPDRRFPEHLVGESHQDGVIFAGALWDTRVALGSAYTDELALRAIKLPALDFQSYLGVLLQEDDDTTFSPDLLANNDLSDGTPNGAAICHAFFDLHGIYHPYCSGQTAQPVAVITEPSPTLSFNPIDSATTAIQVIGSAAGSATSQFQSFVLEWAHQDDPSKWSQAGFSLAGGGVSPVNGGLLGQLDTNGLAEGFYVLRLSVNTVAAPTATTSVTFLIDNSLLSGWPQGTNWYNSLNNPIQFLASPAIADLDPLTPGLEIVGVTWGDDKLHVWHSDGTLAWSKAGAFGQASPAVGDLDGDGDLEIVVHSNIGEVRVLHHDGTLDSDSWPQATHDNPWKAKQYSTPALANLDGDGDLEIVVGSTNGQVYAWHHDGTELSNWPVPLGEKIVASPALGDLNADGSIEIVINTEDSVVHVLTAAGSRFDGGSPLPIWPITLPGSNQKSGSPVLGDLIDLPGPADDGHLEIIIGAGSFLNFKVYALHQDGSTVVGNPGWPQALPKPPGVTNAHMDRPASLVLADIEGDAAPEVLARTRNGQIYIWRGDGTALTGWPPSNPDTDGLEESNSSPAVANWDGNGGMEILADAGSTAINGFTRYDVAAYHHDGAPVAEWPKAIAGDASSTPAIADIDQDGKAEVAIGSHGMFVWNLPGSYTAADAEWPFYRQDIRRTGTYGDTAPPIITLSGEATVTVEACGLYADAGATALDDVDGDLTGQIVSNADAVDTTKTGSYTITYTVSDGAGNAAVAVSRTVNVVDNVPPELKLEGEPEITVPASSVYVDAGATATNCVEGDLTDQVVSNAGDVDTAVLETYEITYNVSDGAGNAAQPVSRIVHVVDMTPPVITLLADPAVTIEACSVHLIPKATAEDNIDGDISGLIAVDFSDLDTHVVSTHEITYNVTDSSGNAAQQVSQAVTVVDTTPPVIQLLGPKEVTVPLGGPYQDPGAIATDCVDGEIAVLDAGSDLDLNTPGTYTFVYFGVSDSSENKSESVSRTIIVTDESA